MNIKFIFYQKNIKVCVMGRGESDVGETKVNIS